MTISRKKRQLLIALTDIFLLTITVFLSLWIRYSKIPSIEYFTAHLSIFIPIIITWLLSLYTAGFYSLEIPLTGYRMLSRLSIIAVICTLLGFAFFYLNLKARLVPKTILVIYGLTSVLLISFWRTFLYKIASKSAQHINIAFAGINDTVIELLQNKKGFSYMNYNTMFLYDENYKYEKEMENNIPVVNNPDILLEEIRKNNVQVVVIADKEKIAKNTTQNILFELLRRYVYFIDLADFYEIYMRRIPLNAVNELWFLTSMNLRSKSIYILIKKFIDIIMALVLFIITLPLYPVIMLLIKLESPGSAFFRQGRTGYLGKPFTIIKFRTMRTENNNMKPTSGNDSRVTNIGKILRKTRLDEIPQFLNIIKSDMSFIGPRPERPELIKHLEKEVPFYRQRLLVKPGISGWDQVSGEYHSPSREDTYKKLQYDLYYIKNMSFFLDASIFFKTLVTIVKKSGV